MTGDLNQTQFDRVHYSYPNPNPITVTHHGIVD